MKNPLRNLLTPDEQKLILFILGFAILGLFIKFTGINIGTAEVNADSLDFSQDFQVVYDLRTCTSQELETIPGIGPKRAATIIAYREEFGFNSLEDLMKVKGIGKATFTKFRPYFLEFGKKITNTESKVSSEVSPISSDLSIININTADAEELTLLPGIGPAKAKLIIQKREELKEFQSIEELLEVKGIGPKTLEKLRNKITIGAEK